VLALPGFDTAAPGPRPTVRPSMPPRAGWDCAAPGLTRAWLARCPGRRPMLRRTAGDATRGPWPQLSAGCPSYARCSEPFSAGAPPWRPPGDWSAARRLGLRSASRWRPAISCRRRCWRAAPRGDRARDPKTKSARTRTPQPTLPLPACLPPTFEAYPSISPTSSNAFARSGPADAGFTAKATRPEKKFGAAPTIPGTQGRGVPVQERIRVAGLPSPPSPCAAEKTRVGARKSF